MKQQRAKFQVIGSCRRMQTLSLEEEFKRMDGVPYVIDFYQDFSTDTFKNLDNMECIPEIINEIVNPKVIDVRQQNNIPSLEDKRQIEDFRKRVAKTEKEDKKLEKKWKKHHKKVSGKQAAKNLKHLYKELMGE